MSYCMNLATFRQLSSLLLFSSISLSVACAEPHPVIDECVGDLLVTVPLTTVPHKVRVEWRAGTQDLPTIFDECTDSPSRLILERRASALVVNDGGFGYTPPPTFDLKVVDRGDCLGNAPDITLVDVTTYSIPGPRESCTSTEVTLPAR